MVVKPSTAGKLLYALLFCAALPVLLIWWNFSLTIFLPVDPAWKAGGVILVLAGFALMAEAMWRLWKEGNGLPMNAYPPTHYVRNGAYQLFQHPIYCGFCMACAGTSVLFMSSAGLYVITPVMIMLSSALVLGYEGPSLKARFGSRDHATFFGLRPDTGEHSAWWDRAGVFCSVFIPWFVAYRIVIYLGTSPGFFDTMLPFETRWPVVELAEIPYVLTYLFAVLMPFVIRSKHQLRAFQLDAWWLTAGGVFFQFFFPFYAEPRAFDPKTWLGQLMVIERSLDGIAGAFPSFHVLWALLAARVWTEAFPRMKTLWWTSGIVMALSCVATRVHSLSDVVAAVVLFLVVIRREEIWAAFNTATERIANSWREWHIGSFRIINHSLYAGLAALAGALVLYQFGIPPRTILLTSTFALVGGALWGQFVEGSPRLLRPFGFYGALLGGIAGQLVCTMVFGDHLLINTAAIALAAPWVQAIGRLRCLVQGCCHGSLTNGPGICYTNKHTRVCHIAGLSGKKIHNTQLYSISCNIITGLVLFRLWYGGCSPALLTGLYFIFNGTTRFVEEAYRGEPQTRIIGGLRMYQWLAIAFILAGAFISTMQSADVLVLHPAISTEAIVSACIAAITWAFGMGMDFPKSNIRFSRLSG